MFQQPERKPSSESSGKLFSVDDVRSLVLKLIGQFCHDVIGCKTRVKFVNSNWPVLICLLLRCSVCSLMICWL